MDFKFKKYLGCFERIQSMAEEFSGSLKPV